MDRPRHAAGGPDRAQGPDQAQRLSGAGGRLAKHTPSGRLYRRALLGWRTTPAACCGLTLDAALDDRLELITSPLLLREITSVLKRPRLRKYLSTDEALRFVADLAAQTILLTDPPGPPAAVCRDPNDDYLVALATARRADAIVTGDPDLHAIDTEQLDIEILTPRQLVDRLA
jgi:putative PIN family toxin of toxin-antitoxin system